MTIPSIIFFIVLPVMLKMQTNFTISLFCAVISTSIAYYLFMLLIKKFNLIFNYISLFISIGLPSCAVFKG